MQSGHRHVASPVLRIPEPRTDLRATQHAKPDTRRYAVFSPEVPDIFSAGRWDDEGYNDDLDSDDRWELVSRLNNNTFTTQTQVASVASVDEPSALSEAQRIIAYYRAVHGGDHLQRSTEINEDPSDDQRSLYTVPSVDTQFTMDMMWRPKPKVRMQRADRMALKQAQTQAIAMMHNAGLKPTSNIQCRRQDCADILPGVEALKYHLHIHDIADAAANYKNAPPSAACESSLIRRGQTSKKSSSRSKSSLGTQQNCSTMYFSTRSISAGSLLPSHISLRESIQEGRQDVPSFTTVARSFISDHSRSKSNPLPAGNNNESCMHTSTPPRGRRARKESMAVSVGAGNHSIAMLLPPPSSPGVHGLRVFTPHINFPLPLAVHPAMDEANDRVVSPNENAHKVSGGLMGPRSPIRALSPTRAMSPIRNGIKRVLSIGYSAADSN